MESPSPSDFSAPIGIPLRILRKLAQPVGWAPHPSFPSIEPTALLETWAKASRFVGTTGILGQFSYKFFSFGHRILVFGLDFLAFGNKRRWALQLLDKTLGELEVNPGYLDDGMKYIIYMWVIEEETRAGGVKGVVDSCIRDAAALLSFCILGAEETEELWGPVVRSTREARLDTVLEQDEDDTLDAKLIKLVLAKGLAAPDIHARVALE